MADLRERIEKITSSIDHTHYPHVLIGGLGMLAAPVNAAMTLPQLAGDPAQIRRSAEGWRKAASTTDNVQLDIDKMAAGKIPDVWVGKAAEKASQVIEAAADELTEMSDVFLRADKTLAVLADEIEGAHREFHVGQGILGNVLRRLDVMDRTDIEGFESVKRTAQDAMGLLLGAVDKAQQAGRQATRQLNDFAAKAHLAKLNSANLSPADRLALAQAATPGGEHQLNQILTAAESERAADRMNHLNPEESAQFQRLLSEANSPQERAYLLKTLAAGHNMQELQQFSGLIHAHGDDPEWLRNRLSPLAGGSDVSRWEQGPRPTCVASSTVTVRASIDPIYALQLTTGGHPDDPAFENKEAFTERLRGEQSRVYDTNRGPTSDWPIVGHEGMTPSEGDDAHNHEIAPGTGHQYEHRGLGSDGERSEVLTEVEKSVDNGRPVPVQVEGKDDHGDRTGHQMMIIGHEDGRLLIYNPWGTTTWVSEDDFIHGHMDKASDKHLPNVAGVSLPK
ncbi:hypothetical protein D5S17_16015 [Pseudonocardiaceae bacterium YIM PH 21723]|nr:hypothetical protein D5S17_16015 [Pseudonocardiaceae bacterium YIM PH 21723]